MPTGNYCTCLRPWMGIIPPPPCPTHPQAMILMLPTYPPKFQRVPDDRVPLSMPQLWDGDNS